MQSHRDWLLAQHGAHCAYCGTETSPDVHQKLASLSRNDPNQSAEKQAIALIAECFRLSLSRAAVYVLPEQFDVHAPELAQDQPRLFGDAISKIAALLQGLVDTPFDAKRSMFDVTTVMIASEFGRTMRAPEMPIESARCACTDRTRSRSWR